MSNERLINKPTITSVSSDTVFYTDSATNGVNGIKASDFPISDDTQSALDSKVSLSGAQTITGGKAFAKGAAFYGNDLSDLPTTVGSYVAAYYSSAYSTSRLLGYNGSTYQSLALGAMPTAGTFALKLNTDGTATFGYGINIEAKHYVGQTGQPAFQNGWTNFDSNYSQCSFYKDNFGIVHLAGLVKSGTSNTVFTLPSGYIPSKNILIQITGNNEIYININGEVTIPTTLSYVSLENISFRV